MERTMQKMDKSTGFSSCPNYTEEHFEYYYRMDEELGNILDTERALVVNGVWHMQYVNDVDASCVRLDYYGFYLMQGTVHVYAPIEAELHAGDLIIYAPGSLYRYKNEGKFVYYSFHFTGYAAKELLSVTGFVPNRVYHPGIHEGALSVMHSIYDCFRYCTPLWETESAAYLSEFLIRLGKSMIPDTDKDQCIRNTAAYIRMNLSRPITISELAEMAFMSISGYRAKFRKYYGMAPTEYLTAMRVRYAIRLLEETDLSVSTVAEECGFSDPYYFSRIFRKQTGTSPRAFRKQKRGERVSSD